MPRFKSFKIGDLAWNSTEKTALVMAVGVSYRDTIDVLLLWVDGDLFHRPNFRPGRMAKFREHLMVPFIGIKNEKFKTR